MDEGEAVGDGARAAGGRLDVEAAAFLVVDPGGLRAVGGPADVSEAFAALALPVFQALGDAGAAVFELGEADQGVAGAADPPSAFGISPRKGGRGDGESGQAGDEAGGVVGGTGLAAEVEPAEAGGELGQAALPEVDLGVEVWVDAAHERIEAAL